MAPDEMRVLGILSLVLIHRLRGHGGEGGGLRLKERQHIWVHSQTRDRRNLILRHRVQEHPTHAIAVVVLKFPSQIGLIALALIVKDRMPQRRRLDTPIGRRITVEGIVAALLANRAAVLKGWVHRLVRAAKHLGRAEGGARPALAGDIDHERRLVAVLGLHAAEDNIRAFPHTRRNHVGEARAHPFRNRHPIDPELLIGVVLADMGFPQGPIHHTRNRL